MAVMARVVVLASLLLAIAVDAVTVLPGGVPRPYSGTAGTLTPYDFYTQSAANEFGDRSVDIFMSNRDNIDYFVQDDYHVLPSADSFVRGVLQAWGEHLHLVLQPDEIWLTVLAQINFYVNAHSADAASRAFDLRANETVIDAYYPDWYTFMSSLYSAVTSRIRVDWLQHQWISPNFTTSTNEHVMVAHILMLAQTRAFARKPPPRTGPALLCGLPSVSLLGTRQDWAVLQWRVEKMSVFGAEAAAYGARLLPVVRRFVQTFDTPDDPAILEFWNSIVVAKKTASSSAMAGSGSDKDTSGRSSLPATLEPASCGGSSNGPSFNISGWITAFYFWDADGQSFGRDIAPGTATTRLDNITYPSVDLRTLPVAYGRTKIVLPKFNGTDNFEILAMGGPMGKRIDKGAPTGYFEALNRTQNLNLAPWIEADGNNTIELDGPPTNDLNQTYDQWANASFGGYDPRKHATMSPLTSWILYGPDLSSASTALNSNDIAPIPPQWQPELELGTVAAALLSNYNSTQCSSSKPPSLARRHARWQQWWHGP